MRFSIRDVLWLTVVVGLALALWIEHRRLAEARLWRTRAGALEQLFIDKGYRVDWNPGWDDKNTVALHKDDQIVGGAVTNAIEPNLP